MLWRMCWEMLSFLSKNHWVVIEAGITIPVEPVISTIYEDDKEDDWSAQAPSLSRTCRHMALTWYGNDATGDLGT